MKKLRINLDRNGSYGLLPEVKEELFARYEGALNPSSVHYGGQHARSLIEEARSELRNLLSLSNEDTVVFTSGATEANNWVFNSFRKRKVITTTVEHPSVLEPAGLDPVKISPLQLEEIVAETKRASSVVSYMAANNETGDLFPVSKLFTQIKEEAPHTVCHTDCVQLLGKTEFSFSDLNADLGTISGHKIGGLPGVGALIIRGGREITPFITGGPQETHRRAGTENVLGILSLGLAARDLRKKLPERIASMKSNRDRVLNTVLKELPSAKVNSFTDDLLPNTVNLRLPIERADDLVVALDLKGVAISSGAACASGKPTPSHVLLALGLSEEEARSSIRISVGAEDSVEELDTASALIVSTVKAMNKRAA